MEIQSRVTLSEGEIEKAFLDFINKYSSTSYGKLTQMEAINGTQKLELCITALSFNVE